LLALATCLSHLLGSSRPWCALIVLLPFLSITSCQRQPGTGHVAEAGPVKRPRGPLGRDDAAKYVLALVNHDRGQAGLSAVEWDDIAARAGEAHAEDMASHGYTAHWGTDGSVPEERYTTASGTDFVQENAACFFDGENRPLDRDAKYDPVELEKVEAAFMAELPPNDGHKKNILDPSHTKLGVGLAQPRAVHQPCMAQEFVDTYGDYSPLPRKARVGGVVPVSGKVNAPLKFGSVGIARIDPAHPMTAEELNQTHTYQIPSPYVLYSPPGFVSPKPVKLDGNRFSVDVQLSDQNRPGRYEVSIWATFPGAGDKLDMISQRVIDVK
jgi:uncharacterized protein YkwD